jgi:hypothetical protein
METTSLSIPKRLGVSILVGIAFLAVLLAVSVVVMGQTERLNYANGVAALAACGIAASTLSVLCMFGPLRSYVSGENRQAFLKLGLWVSMLLPVAATLESAFRPTMSYWWFFFPAQYIVAGALGIAVAVSRGRWWWGLGLWGVMLTACGVLGATVPFWAK